MALRCGSSLAVTSRPASAFSRAPGSCPCRRYSSSSSVQKRNRRTVTLATPDEEREIEAMKKAAESGSIMDSEAFSVVFKIGVVATFVAVSVGIAKIGEPVIQGIIQAFPVSSP